MAWEELVKKFWQEQDKVVVDGVEFAPKSIPDDLDEQAIDEVVEKAEVEDKEVFKAWLQFEVTGEYPAEKQAGRRVEDSYEDIMDKVRSKVWRELDNHDSDNGELHDMYIVHTFPDAVIVRDEANNGRLFEVPYVKQESNVYLGQIREVESVYVTKRLEEAGVQVAEKCELTGPIVMKNAAKRLAYAAVLVPGEPDHDGETVTAEKVEEAAHEWMHSYRNVDLQHTLNNVAVPVESFILPMDWEVEAFGQKVLLPQGTWVLATKVLDDATWERVQSGELTGYSVMGIRRTTMESATKSAEMALKKTLLRDLGPDWVAAAVSIVDEPAVPKAKFFALKARKPATKSWYQRVVEAFTPAKKEGRRFSENTYEKLRAAFNNLKELLDEAEGERASGDNGGFTDSLTNSSKEKEVEDMKPEELKGLIDEAVKAAVEPLQTEITTLKSQVEGQGQEESGEGEEGGGQDNQANDDLEAFKSQVIEKLEKLEERVGRKFASSKSLKGQDGEEQGEQHQPAIKGRDAFGRKRGDK